MPRTRGVAIVAAGHVLTANGHTSEQHAAISNGGGAPGVCAGVYSLVSRRGTQCRPSPCSGEAP